MKNSVKLAVRAGELNKSVWWNALLLSVGCQSLYRNRARHRNRDRGRWACGGRPILGGAEKTDIRTLNHRTPYSITSATTSAITKVLEPETDGVQFYSDASLQH